MSNFTNIPKRIWALWLDFKNKQSGNTENIQLYIDRIRQLHQGYEINIITEWDILYSHFNTEDKDKKNLINSVLDNINIDAAHKSDFLRFYLLNKYGGFWVDISTFLVSSLDKYIKYDFVCFIAPEYEVGQWIIEPLRSLYRIGNYEEVVKKFKKKQPE